MYVMNISVNAMINNGLLKQTIIIIIITSSRFSDLMIKNLNFLLCPSISAKRLLEH